MPHGKFQRSFDELACAYCLRRMSRRLSVLWGRHLLGVLFWGILGEDILAALGHLPEYPTRPKAMGWCCVRSTVEFTWPIEPFFQYGSLPWGLLWFLGNWIGRLTRVHPFSSDKGSGEGRTIPKFCLCLPGAFHRTILLYYGC